MQRVRERAQFRPSRFFPIPPNSPLTTDSHLWYTYFCRNRQAPREGVKPLENAVRTKGRAKEKRMPASPFEIATSRRCVRPPWPEFYSFHAQPLSFHILMHSASVNPFGAHTSIKSHIYIKTMGFKAFRHTYLQSVFPQTLLNHILTKKVGVGVVRRPCLVRPLGP